jgi:casein kinase II subunit alpha
MLLLEMHHRHMLYELVQAIAHGHSHGTVHRDIKPLNIAFHIPSMIFRLLDWGSLGLFFSFFKTNLNLTHD